MEWTKQKLAHYIGNVRTVVEFQGITKEELGQIFHDEAVLRLQQVEDIILNEYLSNGQKVRAIQEMPEAH